MVGSVAKRNRGYRWNLGCNQLTLKQGGYLGRPYVVRGSLKNVGGRSNKMSEVCDYGNRVRCCAAALKVEKGGEVNPGIQVASKVGEDKEMNSFLEPPEMNTALLTPVRFW